MFAKKSITAALCGALGALIASSIGYAAPGHGGGSTGGSALPCAYSDFVGGAPYPTGFGPVTEITYPNTGEYVTGRVYVQQGSYAGIWNGDSMPGGISQIQLFVDGALTATMVLGGKRLNPLLWNASGSGTHQVMVRMFSINLDKTKTCYVDSPPEYPVVL